MSRACPWCREPLGLGLRRARECPHCGRSLVDESGRELRDIDLRYDRVVERQQALYRQMLAAGVPTVAAVALVLPLLHVGAVAMAPLLVVVHLVAVRVWLLRDAFRLLGARRRRFLRWLTRLGFLWFGVLGYGAAAIPLVGVLAAVLTFVVLTTAVHAYAGWSVEQEWRRQGLARWERILLRVLVVATLLVLALLAVLAAAVGWSAAALVEWLGH